MLGPLISRSKEKVPPVSKSKKSLSPVPTRKRRESTTRTPSGVHIPIQPLVKPSMIKKSPAFTKTHGEPVRRTASSPSNLKRRSSKGLSPERRSVTSRSPSPQRGNKSKGQFWYDDKKGTSVQCSSPRSSRDLKV